MKKLLSTLLLAAAVPATMLAKPVQETFITKVQKAPVAMKKAAFIKADAKINPALLMVQQGSGSIVDTVPSFGYLGMYGSTGFTNDSKMIQYDEKTDAVFVLNNSYSFKLDDNPGSVSRGVIDIQVYPNGGKVVGSPIRVYDKADTIAWYPSFNILNPTGTTDPKKINIFVASQDLRNVNPTTRYFTYYNKSAFSMYNGSPTTGTVPLVKSVYESGPNNSPDYRWNYMNPVGYTSVETKAPYYVIGASLFASTESGKKHGVYGVALFENSTDTQDKLISDFPAAFSSTQFKAPTSTAHYNSPVLFGVDEEGTLYGMINNQFVNDDTKRLPAVSKSVDAGASWGAFDVMPWSVFDNYAQSAPGVNGTPTDEFDFGFAPFNSVDFTVLSKDNFSYAAIVFLQSKTTNDLLIYDIVEVYKEAGQWGMRKIEDMRTRATAERRGSNSIGIFYQGGAAPVEDKLVYDFSTRAHEIELGITKDKKYIVAKWIDNVFSIDAEGLKEYNDIDTLETSTAMYESTKADQTTEWVEQTIKGYCPTAIYFKYRKIGTTNWSEAVRLTNDNRYHLHTHMPDVIPSLSQIPMLTSVSMDERTFSNDTSNYINHMPIKQRNMVSFEYRHTLYNVYNGTPASIDDNSTISKEAVSVFPNPTTGEFTVKFNASANSTVEIFNTLGEKIMDVKGTTANAAGLNNGIYLVKVTNNGVVTSTMFTVAK